LSGSGTFAEISEENKTVEVEAGAALLGTVALRVLNTGPGFAVAPLIQTTTWGRHEDSWKVISNLRPGESTWNAQVNERAPAASGTYYILFAFNLETNGASVASATNWASGPPVWDDGNDLADFGPSKVRQAQQFGCAVNLALSKEGYAPIYVPADAITVRVGAGSAGRAITPSPSGPEVGPPPKGSIYSKLSDDFTRDHSLNESIWAPLPTLAGAPVFKSDLRPVPANLAFTSSGMIMSGVNGTYQYTGIQSRGSFAPPFILEATVRATMSHGNPFELRLVNADGSQGIVLNAHLEPADRGYGGVLLGHTTGGQKLGDVPRTLCARGASLGTWCTIRYAVDKSGVGTVVMKDFQGARLANQTGLVVGAGPFFLVLAQWEGWPHSPGKNEAAWGHIDLSSPAE
jgi:hypothetical protein